MKTDDFSHRMPHGRLDEGEKVIKDGGAHNIPESASALWRMVSFTAANTSRMLDVSVACVRLEKYISSF